MCDLLNYDLTDKQIAKLQNSIVRGKCLQYVLPTLSVLECTLHKKKRSVAPLQGIHQLHCFQTLQPL